MAFLRCTWIPILLFAAGACGASEPTAGRSVVSDGGGVTSATSGGTSVASGTGTGSVVVTVGSSATSGAGGSFGSGTGGGGGQGGAKSDGGLDCSNVGCAQPAMCRTGCTAPCGCCPCTEGTSMGSYLCVRGCWDEILDAGGQGCTYLGRSYPSGVTFAAGDGCNTCTCGASSQGTTPICTKNVCECDPSAEIRRREYIGKSAYECATIKYTCPDNTTMFANMCGCGCEQDPSCPDWFDCEPAPSTPPCDTAALKKKCPYSGIAF